MKNIIIRHAAITDLSALLSLIEQLGYPTSQEMLQARFKKFIKNDGYGIAVACLDQQVIGWVAWSKSLLFVLDKTRFYIEGLVVSTSYQGQSVGTKLMIFVEEIAQQFSPAIIDLTSGLRRAKDGSHDFYKNLGYQNDGPMAKLYLRKEI